MMTEINEMVIRVPGMGEAEARSMGEAVAGKMAAMLPADTGDRNIDELNIKLSITPGAANETMADDIAKQILQQLKML